MITSVNFVKTISWLVSLDISYNRLVSLEQTLDSLVHLSQLKILYMIGNAFCMYKHYRQLTCKKLPHLLHLDEIQVEDEKEAHVTINSQICIKIYVEKLILSIPVEEPTEKSKKPNAVQKPETAANQQPTYEKKFVILHINIS